MYNCYLGRQTLSLQMSSLFFFFLYLNLLSMTTYGMDYKDYMAHPNDLFGQLRSAVPAVSSPNFLCTASLLTGGAV